MKKTLIILLIAVITLTNCTSVKYGCVPPKTETKSYLHKPEPYKRTNMHGGYSKHKF